LILVLTTTAACSNGQAKQPTNLPTIKCRVLCPLERGNSPVGQDFGNWVVQTAKTGAYKCDNNKLGVVITPQVRPNEVKPHEILVQGFHRNFRT